MFFRANFNRMPYSIIKKDSEIVAFIIVEPSGYLKAHFVLPEHRGKGLGKAVEQDLSQKCIE